MKRFILLLSALLLLGIASCATMSDEEAYDLGYALGSSLS